MLIQTIIAPAIEHVAGRLTGTRTTAQQSGSQTVASEPHKIVLVHLNKRRLL